MQEKTKSLDFQDYIINVIFAKNISNNKIFEVTINLLDINNQDSR